MIVTIKQKLPLYKKAEKANKIELVTFEENSFTCVSQIDRFQIGDKAYYIEPDYCLNSNILFNDFIAPNGDQSKSYLGKINGLPSRIRAKKFNFTLEPNSNNYVYSNGILLTWLEIENFFQGLMPNEITYTDLGVYKYEAPEDNSNGPNVSGKAKPWPSGIYKTDETNIFKNIKDLEFPVYLTATEKIDGSSITIGVTNEYPDGFICSRNIMKSIFINKVVGRKKKTFIQKLLFWKKFDLNIYERVLNEEDDFVKYGYPVLQKLLNEEYINIVLRGELCGKGLKGSGNPKNPHANEEPNIKFFGIDYYENGIAKRIDYYGLHKWLSKLKVKTVNIAFCGIFESKEQLFEMCENYFKDRHSIAGELIEGLVIRSESGFSAKYMNNLYDEVK